MNETRIETKDPCFNLIKDKNQRGIEFDEIAVQAINPKNEKIIMILRRDNLKNLLEQK